MPEIQKGQANARPIIQIVLQKIITFNKFLEKLTLRCNYHFPIARKYRAVASLCF